MHLLHQSAILPFENTILVKLVCFTLRVHTQFISFFSCTLLVCLWKTIKTLWLLIDLKHDTQKPQNPVVFSMSLDDKLHFGKLQGVEKKERNQFAWACRKSLHHLPDALCQQVRALIDLRLPNCTLIKERVLFSSFLPFDSDFIYFVLPWTQLGSMCRSLSALCECLVHSREFIFFPTRDLRGGCTAGSQWPRPVTQRSNM